ncbi:PRC-barrel domain-containing protein [Roseiterribacter gracilis]|uniref:PRC-barrel domain-containing protein n=1 Tax=Roseiterribacter gracilis TaxID=2812848 RepID=A0A8S8X9F3_9PROT|nr:hypothetical protein TMPK1_09490 [Rhodospirillales bacterium TMPK1]
MRSLFAGAAIALAMSAGAAHAADLTPQTITSLKIDATSVQQGWRASKVIGATVKNDADETIGKIDDLIVGRSDQVLYAVVGVGGFLGVGEKNVVVPYRLFRYGEKVVILPGGTKDALKNLPKFEYQKG